MESEIPPFGQSPNPFLNLPSETIVKTEQGFATIKSPVGKALSLNEMKRIARSYAHVPLTTLLSICEDEKANKMARVMASSEILNRGYGKPSIEIGLPEKLNTYNLKNLSDSELFTLQLIMAKLVVPEVEKEMKNVTHPTTP